MYFLFLGEVLKRAFTPAPRVTDILQILAASALPAASKFFGIHLPQNASENALAYIGLAALSFVVIRLVWAPYAIWKEQNGEIANLKTELTKPQRLELERMAAIRADAKAELATLVQHMIFMSIKRNPKRDGAKLSQQITLMISFCGRANTAPSFDSAVNRLGHRCFDAMQTPKEVNLEEQKDILVDLGNAMQAFLHGDITAEALALQLPPYTESETPL